MRIRQLLLAGATIAGVAACGPVADSHGAGLQVLAAETFLADIAQTVAGERAMVASLLAPGVDPHEFQATPKDAIKMAQADLLIINGMGYEAWLEKSLEAGGSELHMVEASTGVSPGPQGDPHLWMNPLHVRRYAENIRDGLSEVDPDGRSVYARNAEEYVAELQDLDTWIKAEVSQVPPEKRILITNHHALGSFAEAYGFEIAGVVIPSSTSGAAPSAQPLATLIRTIESLEVRAIFLDVSESPDLAQQLASESGAQVITGLYVETLSEAGGQAGTYIDMMKHDVETIVEALK